jgi:phytanoyl-CoA hydroxylase
MTRNDYPALPAELEQLHTEGYFIRDRFFAPEDLDEICEWADRAVAYHNVTPREKFDMYQSVSRRDGIMFVNEFIDNSQSHRALQTFAFQPRIVAFNRSVAGPRAAHHCYQLVYKFPQYRAPFPWHQDHIHTPTDRCFYNMWIALNDMTVENGCLWVLPRVGLDTVLEYHDTPYGKSCWSLEAPEQGIPMEMKRGSIFVITSKTLHKSGPNCTDTMRKAMLIAFVDQDAIVYGAPVEAIPYA